MANPHDQLREQLLRLQRTSQCARARRVFYPLKALEEVLTEDVTRTGISLIPSLGGNQRDLSRFSTLIQRTALRTFAILLLDRNESYVLDFLFRREGDSRIPYTDEQGLYFLPKEVAHRFLERQWEFDPVVLEKGTIHLEIGHSAILPFLEDVKKAKGGFGTVYKVDLHPTCQKLLSKRLDEPVTIARKELDEDDGGSEQAVLELLGEKQHPHIVEFLGSYTQFGVRNLLFPYIPLSMKEFLVDPPFTEPWILLRGMYGLADALSIIHNFTFKSESVDIHKIGYHHDLRPANILVRGTTFLIADFGLSRLKPDDETSKSRLRGGHDDYLGPESFNVEDWTNRNVGRALDIWAFGCILSEILTVMEDRRVANFREKREASQTLGNLTVTNCAFHLEGKIRPSVTNWLANIAANPNHQETKGIERLILEMLNTNPYRRTKIEPVALLLALLAEEAISNHIARQFNENSYDREIRNRDVNKLILLEQKLFDSWKRSTNHLYKDKALQNITMILSALQSLHEALDVFKQSCAATETTELMMENVLRGITTAMDCVLSTLPSESQIRVEELWIYSIGDIYDIGILEAISSAPRLDRYRAVGIKASMAYMSRLISTSARKGIPSYSIDAGCISVDKGLPFQLIQSSNVELVKDRSRIMGHYDTETGKRRAVIEWKEYDHRWRSTSGSELYEIMNALARLLDPKETPREGVAKDRILDCVGYFHEKEFFRFGFVYLLPSSRQDTTNRRLNLFSLNNAIRITDAELPNTERPDLGDVFSLASSLASCLLALHEVDWLHKNLSSHQILIFSPSADEVHRHVVSAVLAGFNDSRPEASSITLGPRDEFPHYQHPMYQKGISFRRSFDYFSLGIVLLELGLWQPISVLRGDHPEINSAEEFQRELLQTYVPVLGEKMGVIFRDAATFCLDIVEDALSGQEQTSAASFQLHEEFKVKVVGPLSRCCA